MNTTEEEFIVEKLKKFRIFPRISGGEPEWFAHFSTSPHSDASDNGVYLRRPDSGEYGQFLALCKLVHSQKFCLGPILWNPLKLKKRNIFYLFPPQYECSADYESLYAFGLPRSLQDKNGVAFLFGTFLTYHGDKRWAAMLKREPGTAPLYAQEFPDLDEERYEELWRMRLDLENWDSEHCLCRHIMSVPGESIEGEWMALKSDYDLFCADAVVNPEDWKSIVAYIQKRRQQNFVDMTDIKVTIESKFIEKWLKALAPTGNDDPEFACKIVNGVMLLNNVLCQMIDSPNADFAAKIRVYTLDGMPDVKLCKYSAEAVKRITASFHFSFDKKEGTEARINYWIDFWKRSPSRARVTAEIFEPWPINAPISLIQPNTAEYQTNRVINTFSGYGFTWQELKDSFLDPTYSNTIKDFEQLVKDGFCSQNAEYAEYFLDWLAHIHQKPAKKTGKFPIIKTPTGVGKGFLARLLSIYWGPWFLFLPGEGIDEHFNGHLQQKVLIFMDELNATKDTIQLAKSAVTEQLMMCKEKYKEQKPTRSHSNWMAATNLPPTIEITPDNRRWVIFETEFSKKRLENWKPFICRLWKEWVEGGEKNGRLQIKQVFYFLMTRNITKFDPHGEFPVTPYMKKYMEHSIPLVHVWWQTLVRRRQITTQETQGSPPSFNIRDWAGLFSLFKTDDLFVRMYGQKRKSEHMTLQEFKDSLREVVAIAKYRGDEEKFTFLSWTEQINKWNSIYSYSLIDLDPDEVQNPMIASKIADLRQLQIDTDIKNLTPEEMKAALQTIKDELEEQGMLLSFHGFTKRKPDEMSDLVVFGNESNKKRKQF